MKIQTKNTLNISHYNREKRYYNREKRYMYGSNSTIFISIKHTQFCCFLFRTWFPFIFFYFFPKYTIHTKKKKDEWKKT